jgi:hypothetical protein
MTFQEVLAQVIAWLQREQRVSNRALKQHFGLDDDGRTLTSWAISSTETA